MISRSLEALGDRRVPLFVLLASFALKSAVFLALYPRNPERIVGQDTATYERPALALLDTGRFAIDAAHPDIPATLVPPGYPAFIASIYFVFGERRAVVIVAQILITLLTLWMVFMIGVRLWGRAAGALAMVALALDLLSFTYAQILFADTLFTAALVAACYAAVEHLLTGRLRWAVGFAAALAIATLVRPISYYLFWPIVVAILIREWRGRHSVARFAAVAVSLSLPWILLVGSWRAHNQRMIGRAQVSDIQSVNLLLYRAAGVVAIRDSISFFDAQKRLAESLPDPNGRSRGEIDALYEREALRILAAHPLLFLRMEAFGLVKVVAGSARAEFLHYYGGEPYEDTPSGAVGLTAAEAKAKFAGHEWVVVPVLYVFVHLGLLYAAALYGIWIGFRRPGPRAPLILLAAVGIYLALVAAGPEAYARFRVPIMPCIALFAGAGLAARRPLDMH